MFDLTRNSAAVQEIIGLNNRYFQNTCFRNPDCLATDSINDCCALGNCACPK